LFAPFRDITLTGAYSSGLPTVGKLGALRVPPRRGELFPTERRCIMESKKKKENPPTEEPRETATEEQKDRNMGVLLLAWKVLRKARKEQPVASGAHSADRSG